ncbi:hypothetical protein LUZ60_003762 [Juncus effusus]|nr:hypothetical protein LUZ60_003762 [Juncus effusus]
MHQLHPSIEMESLNCGDASMSFSVDLCGHSGHLRLLPSPSPSLAGVNFVLPPAFPAETAESVRVFLEENYLKPELDSDAFSVEKSGKSWDFDWFQSAGIPLEVSDPRAIVAPSWALPFRRSNTWDPPSFQVEVEEVMEDSGRRVGAAKDYVRGSLKNRPFRPGGLKAQAEAGSADSATAASVPEGARNGDWVKELVGQSQSQSQSRSQTVPPGFHQGVDLGPVKEYPTSWTRLSEVDESAGSWKPTIDENVEDKFSVRFDDLFKKAFEDDDASEIAVEQVESPLAQHSGNDSQHTDQQVEAEKISSIDEILSAEPVDKSPNKSETKVQSQEREGWALTGGNEEIISRFYELVPDMAIEFPFELDTFQKEAIYYLEKGESVFVAAHTSAGKTVVAEYAFALSSKHCTRAVYTAPIKTISNQKYRDFCGKFDVGLLTGDVSIRPEATCLIMTTEILRSMLYKGADIIRDIEWVIFDEVHYVNDAERGVVWEEVIIMLPKHINIILLSATVPNTVEFADWIGRTKQKRIRVTSTRKRPVPLEHCIFYWGELYKICENELFIPQGYKAAKDTHKKRTSSSSSSSSSSSNSNFSSKGRGAGGVKNQQGFKQQQNSNQKFNNKVQQQQQKQQQNVNQNSGGPRRSDASLWLLLINNLARKSLLPVVIFCFSKNRCDKSADFLYALDLTNQKEKSEIHVFCDKAFSRLKGSDRDLPQLIRIQSLLKRGIGVHHAGLLPIVKEVVEMLFCRGVIKVLFSTETFAMGVNAPARTVVFDTLRKFDGKDHRTLLAGEYIQMAGRAGRRGLDDIGTVIVMCRDDIIEESELKHLIVGRPTRLESQFRLTYTMILHLLRVEDLKVEDMLKRSFAEFHAQKNLPEKERELLQKLQKTLQPIQCIKGEPAIEEYYDLATQAEIYREEIAEALMKSPYTQQFLSPGRILVIKSQSVGEDPLLGVVLKSPSTTFKQYLVLVLTTESESTSSNLSSNNAIQQSNKDELSKRGYFMVPKGKRGMDDDYLSVSSTSSRKSSGAVNIKLPYYGTAAGTPYSVIPLESNTKDIMMICDKKIKIDIVRLLEDPSNSAYSRTVQLLLELKSDSTAKYPPALDPVKDLKMKDMLVVEQYRAYNKLVQRLTENKCHGCIKFKEHLSVMKEQKMHKEEVNALKFQMSDEALQQMPDFQGRIDVLKEINCIDGDLVVQLKGRVACEMNSGEELICTECLFDNQLDELEPEEAVALMSALVFQQTNTSDPSFTPKLASACQRLYDTAIRLGELQKHFKISVDPQDYAKDNLKFGLVEVVYEWAKGTEFKEICELTDVSEGLIVRTILRLDETCREFRNAAAIMGNSALFKKMERASEAIKRDIVFAASLYVTGV